MAIFSSSKNDFDILARLLEENLADMGFYRKERLCLCRKTEKCDQLFSFYAGQDFRKPGAPLFLDVKLRILFWEVDTLTAEFLGDPYAVGDGMGYVPLDTVVQRDSAQKYYFHPGDSIERFAQTVTEDFRRYAFRFYDQYNSLEAVGAYFSNQWNQSLSFPRLQVVCRMGEWKPYRRDCYIAAVLCVLHEWERLRCFLYGTNLLLEEHRKRIIEYASWQHVTVGRYVFGIL